MIRIASDLLKANHIGIREMKEKLSKAFLEDPLVITDRGVPVSVNLPYEEVMELIDILDELSDQETLATIAQGRKAIKRKAKG